jgi:hypothetical protein
MPMDGQQGQAETVLAECRRARARAMRWVVITGVLLVALVVAAVFAAVDGRYHGMIVFLVPVLIVMNLLRLGQYVTALGKIRRAERLARDAQAVLRDR